VLRARSSLQLRTACSYKNKSDLPLVIDRENEKPNGVFDLSTAPNATTPNPTFGQHAPY
jgi:hypothetical protein